MKTVLLILLDKRKETALKIQKILTVWGCLIKTRIGLHDDVLENCSESGLIILQLVGSKAKHKQLEKLLANLPGVKAKLVEMSF